MQNFFAVDCKNLRRGEKAFFRQAQERLQASNIQEAGFA
jgi:hypothetical protein